MRQPSRKKTTATATEQVRSRLVLNFPGFEQTDSIAQLGRLRYGAEQTGEIWGFGVEQGEMHHPENSHHTFAAFNARGANWKTDIRLVQFRWNDIVHAYERDSFPGGYLKNYRKYLAFFLDGTVGNYRRASSRYWGFTLFPLLLTLVMIILSWFVAGFMLGWLGLGAAITIPLQLAMTVVLALALSKWPGDRLYLPLTIADWGFARDMVDRSNQEIESRFAEFGDTVGEEISKSGCDEIIIVGHSFGSLWAVSALAGALRQKPDLLKGKKVRFLALGSSMLKIALCPDATFIRENWQRVTSEPNLFWHEIQTKDDWIAFYKSDPFEQKNIAKPESEYIISRIRFADGMAKKRYRAMRKSFYRTHRQYILYYDKRVPFDYMLRLFGPLDAKTLAQDKQAHLRIDPEGRLG